MEQLAAKEWQIDSASLVPRDDMEGVLVYAKKAGKKLVLTSDCYYSKLQIESILQKFNLDYFDYIFISCEEGVSKTTGLFEKLLRKNSFDELRK